MLIPLSFGWVLASFASGQYISRTGRYKVFPILGSLLVLAGCILLALLDEDTSRIVVTLDLTVVGLGMGTMFQTFVIATQNRVDMSEIGVATAAIQFFRSMGGSLAVAGLGALLTARLARRPRPGHPRRLRRDRPARGADRRARRSCSRSTSSGPRTERPDYAALQLPRGEPRDLLAQVAHLGVVGERQRALARLEAVGDPVRARERVREARPGGLGLRARAASPARRR